MTRDHTSQRVLSESSSSIFVVTELLGLGLVIEAGLDKEFVEKVPSRKPACDLPRAKQMTDVLQEVMNV